MQYRPIDRLMFSMNDPKTGLPILPLYRRTDGSYVWPIMGASPDDEDDAADEDEDPPDTDEDEDESDEDTDEDEPKGKRKVPTPTEVELERVRRRMKAADRRATTAEKRLKEYDDKDKTELQLAKEQHEELQKKYEALEQQYSQRELENAFLSVKLDKVNWANPGTAMLVAEREGYLEDARDEDGKVDRKALKEALRRLAKEHKYLTVAQTDEDENEEDERDTPKPTGGPTATPVGSRRRKGKGQDFDETELRRKYPALNR